MRAHARRRRSVERCRSCGAEADAAAGGGVPSCARCARDSVRSDAHCQRLFSGELVAFFNSVLGLPLDRWNVQVRLCAEGEVRTPKTKTTVAWRRRGGKVVRLGEGTNDGSSSDDGAAAGSGEARDTYAGVDHVHTGECCSSVQVNEVFKPSGDAPWGLIHERKVKEIRLLRRQHPEFVGRTLAHEALHGWLALWHGLPCGHASCRVCPQAQLPHVVAEGLCEFAAWMYLEARLRNCRKGSHAERVINHCRQQMLENTVGVYAKGLKMALASFDPGDRGQRATRRYCREFFETVVARGAFPETLTSSSATRLRLGKQRGRGGGGDGGGSTNASPLTSAAASAARNIKLSTPPPSTSYFASRRSAASSPSAFAARDVGGKQGPRAPSSRLGTSSRPPCRHCRRIVEPTASDRFAFVVVLDDAGLGRSVQHATCFREHAPRCLHCSDPLYERPTVSGRRLHKDCFMSYERKHGDICERCGEPLWEEEQQPTDAVAADGTQRTRTAFVRRTSLTHTPQKREVHCRCGDVCLHCGKLLAGSGQIMKNRPLHVDCFLAYEKRHGDKCARCKKPLWRRDKSGGFARRTSILRDGATKVEVHRECGDRCSHCDELLVGDDDNTRNKFLTLQEGKVKVHQKCFVAWQRRTPGMVCVRCNEPLWQWEEADTPTETAGFRKRTCYVQDSRSGNQIEVHVGCGDRCFHCKELLMVVDSKKQAGAAATATRRRGSTTTRRRRGSVVTVDRPGIQGEKKKKPPARVQVHAECFVAFKATSASERCEWCGTCLWYEQEEGGGKMTFQRRASIVTNREDRTKETVCGGCGDKWEAGGRRPSSSSARR